MPGYLTEIHPQAEAFIATLADRLTRGAAFFIDYGFPEAEYYHPQRSGGTLMCHRAHRADADPLADVGEKDITAHVNFTAIALAGQDAGLEVLGYTSQARFLLNCGLADLLQAADLPTRTHAQKLLDEHEMGELFKVIGFARGCAFDADRICRRRPVAHAVTDRWKRSDHRAGRLSACGPKRTPESARSLLVAARGACSRKWGRRLRSANSYSLRRRPHSRLGWWFLWHRKETPPPAKLRSGAWRSE